MSVESKLDTLINLTGQIATGQAANQAALLIAVQAITPGGSQAITDALAQIEGQVAAIKDTIGDETGTGTTGTPAGTPAPGIATGA